MRAPNCIFISNRYRRMIFIVYVSHEQTTVLIFVQKYDLIGVLSSFIHSISEQHGFRCDFQVFWALNPSKWEKDRKSWNRWIKIDKPRQIVRLWSIWVMMIFPPCCHRSKSIEIDNQILAQPLLFLLLSLSLLVLIIWNLVMETL